MDVLGKWSKVAREATGQDLSDRPLSLAEIARIRKGDQGLVRALLENLPWAALGPVGIPFALLSAVSPTFEKELGLGSLLPGPQAIFLGEKELPRILKRVLERVPEKELRDFVAEKGSFLGAGFGRMAFGFPGFVAKRGSHGHPFTLPPLQNLTEFVQLTNPAIRELQGPHLRLPRAYAYAADPDVLFVERVHGEVPRVAPVRQEGKALQKFVMQTGIADLGGDNLLLTREGPVRQVWPIDLGLGVHFRPNGAVALIKVLQGRRPEIPLNQYPRWLIPVLQKEAVDPTNNPAHRAEARILAQAIAAGR